MFSEPSSHFTKRLFRHLTSVRWALCTSLHSWKAVTAHLVIRSVFSGTYLVASLSRASSDVEGKHSLSLSSIALVAARTTFLNWFPPDRYGQRVINSYDHDLNIRQNIISRPRLCLCLVLYSGYHSRPWAITFTYNITCTV